MNRESVPARYAQKIFRTLEEEGHDVASFLRAANCPENLPDAVNNNKDDEFSALNYCKLLRQYTVATRGSFFGLPVTENDAGAGFRMMCLSIIHCRNLEHAINRAAEFYAVYAQPSWQFRLHVAAGRATIYFDQGPRAQLLRSKRITAYDLSAWCRFWGWLTGRYIEVLDVGLTRSEPASKQTHQKLFESPVRFNQTQNSFSFDANYLENPIVHTDESIEEFVSTAPYQLIMMPKDKTDSLTAKIRYIIGCDFTKEFPSYEQISKILNLSSTTLRRKLVQEGTTYQDIKDQTRKDAAVEYLSRPDLTINNTAYLMGFLDPSAFNRTFKRWTGLPPGEYRRRFLGIDGLHAKAED